MQDVRGGVVGFYLLAPDAVNGGRDGIANVDGPAFGFGAEDLVVAGGDGIEDL